MLEKFIKIFEGLNSAHGSFKKDKSKLPGQKVEGSHFVLREEVTNPMWDNHLKGIGQSLGIMPVNEDSKCKWGCIDVDKFELDYEEILKKIRKLSLPLIMCRSKSGCAHIFLFTTKFIPAEEIRFVLIKFAAKLGLADKLDRIFPIQTTFVKGGTGSWLNLPYFNHEEGTRYAYKDDFDAADLNEFFELHAQYAQDNLDQYLAEEEPVKEKKKNNKKAKKPAYMPCVDNCIEDNNGKIPNGIRNDFGFQAAWFFKKSHKAISKFEGKSRTPQSLLSDFNTQYISPPLEEKVITKLTEQLADNDYKPKCKIPGVKKYCDVSLCRRNPFGIDPEFAKELVSVNEVLGDIFEYGSVPPIFYMNVKVNDKGEKLKDVRVEFKGSELKDKRSYITKLQNFGHFPPQTLERMKQVDFSLIMQERIDKRIHIEAEAEAQQDFDFIHLVRDFLDKSQVSIDRWDLLEGACYYDQEKKVMHFRLERLYQYLNAIRQPMKAREIAFKIKTILKGKKSKSKIKNKLGVEKSCPTWFYPEEPEHFTLTIEGKENKKKLDYEKN